MGRWIEGETRTGWAVVRGGGKPWHFVGMYEVEAEAKAKAAEMGPDYEVQWGDNRVGSDDFMRDTPPAE